MKVGDYVFDWELGLWGLILSYDDPIYELLYEDGELGEAYENALGSNAFETKREEKCAV